MKYLLLFALWSLNMATTAQSESSFATSDQQLRQFMARTNTYSPMEGAGSHGSIGFAMGAALTDSRPTEVSNLYRHTVSGDPQEGPDSWTMPRLMLVKGLPIPLDVGLSFGQNRGSQSVGGHLQWTLFESLLLPAVAMRGRYSQFRWEDRAQVQTSGADVVVSYGFLRLFNLYAGMGVSHHQTNVESPKEGGLALLGADLKAQQDFVEETRFQTRQHLAGLEVRIIPPFVKTTLEYSGDGLGPATYAAKLSLAM